MDAAIGSLVGTWTLVSASARSEEAAHPDPFGENPRGVLIYTPGGRVAALISHGDRRPLSADRVAAPVEERAEAFSTFFAYTGAYSLRDGEVIHHVESASVENWVGTDLVRRSSTMADS